MLNPIPRPNLDIEALSHILDSVQKSRDGFETTRLIGANAGTVIEALMWLEAEGHLS